MGEKMSDNANEETRSRGDERPMPSMATTMSNPSKCARAKGGQNQTKITQGNGGGKRHEPLYSVERER